MIRVRHATPDDASTMATLLSEIGYATPADALPGRLRALEEDGSVAFVAVENDDGAIGLACVTTLAGIHAEAPVGYITALVTLTEPTS